MKVSKYTLEVAIDENVSMLYNTVSRKYYVYDNKNRENVLRFLQEINKGSYDKKELELFREFTKNGLIVQDSVDERKKLECLENSARYQEQRYKILIYVTDACNFRCTYCIQEHKVHIMEDAVLDSILKHIEKMSQHVKCIEIDWFGGEPLLEYQKIRNTMKKAIEICARNGCSIKGTMATNGYLLTEEMLVEMVQLHISQMQITVDGNKETHDKRRILADGTGTFDKIIENINAAIKMGIRVTLRINIDEQNKDDIGEVLGRLLPDYREKISVSIANLFQNKERYSTYELLKQAIGAGYVVHNRWNTYWHCHACLKNAIVIATNGDIRLCSNSDSEKRMGYLQEDGNIHIERSGDYWKLMGVTARENPECRNCIELPFCIADCKYNRMNGNETCVGKQADGLTLAERARLDYYSDITMNKRTEEVLK